jgi:hypothetical protein
LFITAKEKYLRNVVIENSVAHTVPIVYMRPARIEAVYNN